MSQKNMILNCSCSLPGGKRSMHHDTVHKFQLQELSSGNKKAQRGVSQSLSMTILLPFHNLSSINMIKVKYYMVITFDTTVSSAMGLFVKVIHCSGVPFLYYTFLSSCDLNILLTFTNIRQFALLIPSK